MKGLLVRMRGLDGPLAQEFTGYPSVISVMLLALGGSLLIFPTTNLLTLFIVGFIFGPFIVMNLCLAFSKLKEGIEKENCEIKAIAMMFVSAIGSSVALDKIKSATDGLWIAFWVAFLALLMFSALLIMYDYRRKSCIKSSMKIVSTIFLLGQYLFIILIPFWLF